MALFDEHNEFYEDLIPQPLDPQDNAFKTSYCQFSVEGNNFIPCGKTVVELPGGYYRIRKEYSKGIFLTKIPVKLNRLVLLESSTIYNEIVSDIVTFWESKENTNKEVEYIEEIFFFTQLLEWVKLLSLI